MGRASPFLALGLVTLLSVVLVREALRGQAASPGANGKIALESGRDGNCAISTS